jgi:hypothetical protein
MFYKATRFADGKHCFFASPTSNLKKANRCFADFRTTARLKPLF